MSKPSGKQRTEDSMTVKSVPPGFFDAEEAAKRAGRPRSWVLQAAIGGLITARFIGSGKARRMLVELEQVTRLSPAKVLASLPPMMETPRDWPSELCGNRRQRDAEADTLFRDFTDADRAKIAAALKKKSDATPAGTVHRVKDSRGKVIREEYHTADISDMSHPKFIKVLLSGQDPAERKRKRKPKRGGNGASARR
jgi:hypothetical protein